MGRGGSKGEAAPGSGPRGPWGSALETLREWDPAWTERCYGMTVNPWSSGVLSRKTVELIGVALNAACTSLNPDGTRRHVRAALEAGATRDEVLIVLKMAALLAIHSCSVAAPVLLEEARATESASGHVPKARSGTAESTPAIDKVKDIGQWNQAWDPFSDLDTAWTEQFMATGLGIYTSNTLPPKDVELLSIALDASCTHMYGPGIRRHVRAALQLGATTQEIMEVLKLCVAYGVGALNLSIPILVEELADYAEAAGPAPR